MRRQIPPPSHLKVAPGYVPHRFLGGVISEAETVSVNHYPPSASDKLIPAIPGFRTSAAFLTSLSANLRIDPDLPSPLLTPSGFRTHNVDFPQPSLLSFTTTQSPSSYAVADTAIMTTETPAVAQAPTDELPQLTTYMAESEEDRIDGLRLVADSVAQQRQIASKMLIFHPINLAAFALAVALTVQRMYTDTDSLFLIATTLGGITMAFLVAVRWATAKYLTLAEDINWEWLGDDRMIVVKWGEEIIGALVLGWADADAAKKPRGGRRRRGKAVVRAWTVRLKYRGKGVGEGLLEEAVKVAGERGADGILFDAQHANSHRVLPPIYNGYMNERQTKAEKKLEKVADEKGNFRQRRSSPTWGSR